MMSMQHITEYTIYNNHKQTINREVNLKLSKLIWNYSTQYWTSSHLIESDNTSWLCSFFTQQTSAFLYYPTSTHLSPSSLLPPLKSTVPCLFPPSHLLACQDVAGQLDLGKVSLANGLEQTVVANVRLLIRAGGDGIPAPSTQGAAGLAGGLVWAAGKATMLEEKGRGSYSMCQCQYCTEQQKQ